ncbi:MAG: 5'-3' exonuclease H3TH domain-containing protein [bacterium]|nr:5'-3' exonuclease H3TH domain-containing protein [bacterium]
MKTFLLIDGHALIYRSYFAIPPFKTKDGFPTNAIYGFFIIITKAIKDFNPSYLTILYDTPKKTFRNKLYKDYQVHRPKAQDDMIIQIPKLKEILDKGHIYQLEKEGFEADDIIGTITTKISDSSIKKIILTGDKDIFQLINSSTYVMTPQIGFSNAILYDDEQVMKKLNVSPSLIADYKALAGDPSDNYPGAKGIGPKTAVKLINEYKSIENLYKNLENIKDERVKKLLIQNEKDVLISKELAVIKKDVNIKFDLKKSIFTGFNEKIKTELLKLGMNGLVSRLFNNKERPINSKIKKPKKTNDEQQINLF